MFFLSFSFSLSVGKHDRIMVKTSYGEKQEDRNQRPDPFALPVWGGRITGWVRYDSLFDPSEREPSFVANGFIAGLAKPLNDSVMHVLGDRPVKYSEILKEDLSAKSREFAPQSHSAAGLVYSKD